MRRYIGFVALGVGLCLPVFAQAEPDEVASVTAFESSKAWLATEGYRQISMLGSDSTKITAIDTEGSEVILTLNQDSDAIIDSSYVHPMDE